MLSSNKSADNLFITSFRLLSINYAVALIQPVSVSRFFVARRDLCNWTKAMQLRYNVSQIEEYLSRREMRDKNMLRELSPLVQV
jgi:hypothetical protein